MADTWICENVPEFLKKERNMIIVRLSCGDRAYKKKDRMEKRKRLSRMCWEKREEAKKRERIDHLRRCKEMT